MMNGGKSLSGVFGERIVGSLAWRITGAWPSLEGTGKEDVRASSRYKGFMNNPKTSFCSGFILTGW